MPAAGLRLGVVFGAPLDLGPACPDPSPEQLDAAHARVRRGAPGAAVLPHLHSPPLLQYVAAVTALWHEHKARFGYGPEQTLSIE